MPAPALIAPPAGALVPERRDLAAYADAGYPDLLRGMIVSVRRGWDLWGPKDALASLLSWRIRHYQSLILDDETTESHTMIYAGGGWCWSQGITFGQSHLSDYKNCRLTFFDRPWTQPERNALSASCPPHKGKIYGFADIAGYFARAVTKQDAWQRIIKDDKNWICSEAVCALVRAILPGFGGPGAALKMPEELYRWMLAKGWQARVFIFS